MVQNFGCNSLNTDIAQVWSGLDDYIHEVDKILCSSECPCNENTVNFQSCSIKVQDEVYHKTKENYKDFDPNGSFDYLSFSKYMNKIENDFNSTGICKSIFFDSSNANTSSKLNRYLFSDYRKYIN